MSQTVILGIAGGIAAYKTPELIRQLGKADIRVVPVLTKEALHFVTKTTIATVAETPPHIDLFSDGPLISHLDIARSADILVIAPATANLIAKCALGLADDLLTTIFLAFTGRVLMVPAMHPEMYLNPATQTNIATLKSRGVRFLGPVQGALACKDHGVGRMAEPPVIVRNIQAMMAGAPLKLANRRILITAGGTRENIDQVRVLTNLSTGMLGHCLADVAAFMGADVTLITTVPPQIPNPEIKHVIPVNTVAEMQRALESEIEKADVLYMAAAVSDYTVKPAAGKLRREADLNLSLVGTPDLLQSLAPFKGYKTYVGFCLEESDLAERARKKLAQKGLDYIVANTPASIGCEKRNILVISAKKPHDPMPFSGDLMQVARELLTLSESFPV